jgi:ABC-type transporter Mla MlaB component
MTRPPPANRHAVRFSSPRGFEEEAGVLKITRLARRGRVQTIKLEGEILAPWVAAVREACTTPGRRSRHLRLDLAAVSYVDAAGVHLLRDLLRAGIASAACSGFVGELLHLEDSGKPGASGAPASSPPSSAHSDRP